MLVDEREFAQALQTVDRVLDRGSRLPASVFRCPVQQLTFAEFGVLWTKSFPRYLQWLGEASGDSQFSLLVLEPDPVDYFFRHFEKFPVVGLSAADSPEDYLRQVGEDPGGSPADALTHNSELLVVFPASIKWAVYADRNLDIAVIAAFEPGLSLSGPEQPSFRLYRIDEAIREILPQLASSSSQAVLEQALTANYRESSDSRLA